MRRELKLKLARLRAKMKEAGSPLDPDLKDDRLARAALDDDAFGALYTPALYYADSPPFHREISEAYTLKNSEIQAYAAPRKHGKTTRSLIHICREICFAQRQRISVFSASEDLAEEIFEPLRITIQENPRIQQDFGDLIKKGGDGEFWTRQDVHFQSNGRDQRLRGPGNDLIVLDDIEDDIQARSKERTDRLLDTIFEVIYNRLLPAKAGGSTFLWIGTILSRKCGLARVLNLNQSPDPEYPDVIGKIWRAIEKDDDGQEYSLWEAWYPLRELKERRLRIGTRRFNKEFQNDPRDADSVFQDAWLRGFHPMEFAQLTSPLPS